MINFEGVDLLLDCPVDAVSLKRALHSVLSVPMERIAVIHDVAQYPAHEDADLVCVLSSVGGDFDVLVSIQTKSITANYTDSIHLVQQVCTALGCRCLVPDEGLNPYIAWLVSPDALPERVALNVSELDKDRYVITHG